jgi:hypothetical protein
MLLEGDAMKFRHGFLVGVLLTSTVFLTCSAAIVKWETKTVAYREGLKVAVNGEEVMFDEVPMIVNPGWIMCQLEPVVKKMGWIIQWDDPNSSFNIMSSDYIFYGENADALNYLKEVRAALAIWEEVSLKAANSLDEYSRNKSLKDKCLDALEEYWHSSETLSIITPPEELSSIHKYLESAMTEAKNGVEDSRMYVKTGDPIAGRDGAAHFDRKAILLREYLKQLEGFVGNR